MTQDKQIEAVALEIWAGTQRNDPLFDKEKAIKEMRRKCKTGSGYHNAELEPHKVTAQAAIEASHAQYVPQLVGALRNLSLHAQTTGGTAGRDEALCAAIAQAGEALANLPEELKG